MFDNDSIKLGDGSPGAATDLGKYFIDRNSNGLKDVACSDSDNHAGGGDECYVDVWNNYDEGDLKGTYTPIGATNIALVKPQGKKAVIFSALYNFNDTATFAKKVDNSMAGMMRDCGECHVGGGANEYVPVVQGTTLAPGARTELRGNPAIVTNGVNTFNYFIDQYDDNNNGVKGEVLPQNYADTGVLEVDCLMCHMEGYSWDDRTHAIRKGNFDASRVAGAGLGIADNAAAGSSAGAGYGKIVTYDPLMVAPIGVTGNAQLAPLALSKITGTPPSANCSSCHFDLHKVDWKKRGDTWDKNMAYETEVHHSLGCMGCHTRTDSLTMDPNNTHATPATGDNPLWTGNAISGTAAATLGHDPSKGNAPYSSLWNKNDDTVRTCAGCHLVSAGKPYVGFGGAPDPTDTHAKFGLTSTLIQTGGMGKMTGTANGNHLDIIKCEGCHVRKLGHGPSSSESMYEWGTGGAMVDGTGPDADGRLTDHENLYVERTMENNLGIAWSGNKLEPRNALVSMFWLDKDDTGVDINADGQLGGMDAVNSMHVRNAMAVAGLQALTADGNMTGTKIAAQKTVLRNYLNGIGIGDSTKLKLSLMGVFFKTNHGTTPAVNAWGAGGCKDCHGVDKGFYNGPYSLKPRDLTATWTNNAGTVDRSAVEGGAPSWAYIVPFTAVNNDNYTGRDVNVPICSTYYGPSARPAPPETPTQAAARLNSAVPLTGDACVDPNPGGLAGTWTKYALGTIKADQQFTDFHPTTWAKGQVGRSIAITAANGNSNTIRTIDRSEGLWEATFVTGTYNGAIKGTDGTTYTTRAAWVNHLNGIGDKYSPSIHRDHAAYDCSYCHSNGSGGTNLDFSLVSGDKPAGAGKWFTTTPSPYVYIAGKLPTCTTSCHVVASAPESSNKAIAKIGAQHSINTNFKVKLTGDKSTCYNVDVKTGVTTQGTKTYAWTYGNPQPTSSTDCADITDHSCVEATWLADDVDPLHESTATLKVTCTSTGTTAETTVPVSKFDVGSGTNIPLTLTTSSPIDVAGGKAVTLTIGAGTMDPEVADVQILWGDNTKTTINSGTIPSLSTFIAAGIPHTYKANGNYTITVVTTNDGDPNNKMFTYHPAGGAVGITGL